MECGQIPREPQRSLVSGGVMRVVRQREGRPVARARGPDPDDVVLSASSASRPRASLEVPRHSRANQPVLHLGAPLGIVTGGGAQTRTGVEGFAGVKMRSWTSTGVHEFAGQV